MLLTCPECELPVSDKALTCPHCGYPISPQAKKNRVCTPRRMRLPNGFGRITKINSKNLRKPYRAMVTVGHDEDGRPIGKLLQPQAYFATYNEAYQALVEYNKNPYDLDKMMTLGELFDTWAEKYEKGMNHPENFRAYRGAWAYCTELRNMKVRELRARHIKGILDGTTAPPTTKSRIKSLFNMMLDYAVEYELVDKNYSRTFVLPEEITKQQSTREHIIFSEVEIDKVWKHYYASRDGERDEVDYADVLLVQCYMGWRPQELGLIRLENVDFDNWTIRGGIKTDNGRDRLVPVPSCIRPIINKFYDEAVSLGSNYLINCVNKQSHRENIRFTYNFYKRKFYKLMADLELNLEHRPHDGRKTFVTMCKKAGVDEYAIKYMVGHAISDITEKVYTDRKNDVKWLHEEIGKIAQNISSVVLSKM